MSLNRPGPHLVLAVPVDLYAMSNGCIVSADLYGVSVGALTHTLLEP